MPTSSILALFKSIRRSQSGNSLIEFSLALPLIVLCFAGVVNVGGEIVAQWTLRAAAETGTDYVAEKGFDSAKIVELVEDYDEDLEISAIPAPRTLCGCPSDNNPKGFVEKSCDATCPHAGKAGQYVVVTASASWSPPIPAFVSSGSSKPIEAEAWIRTR